MPCLSQSARIAAARLSSIVPSALAPVSSCRSMKPTWLAAAHSTACSSGSLRPTSTPIRSRSLIGILGIASPPRKRGSRAGDGGLALWIPACAGMTNETGSSVMLDVAPDVGFPGDLPAVAQIAGALVGPGHPEHARDLGQHRDLRAGHR